MENNKKMFTGFSKVFDFTAMQNIKGKGFKVSTIILALIIAAAFSLISILMAVFQEDTQESENIDSIVELEQALDVDVYYINESGYSDEVVMGITAAETLKECKFIKIEEADKDKAVEDTNTYLEGKTDALVMKMFEENEEVKIELYLPYNTDVDKSVPDTLGEVFVNYFEYAKSYELTNLNDKQFELYNAGVYSQTLKAGEEAVDLGVMLTKTFVPMLFSLLLFMMIMLYGQNITKIVVSEKSSKLMETLLTSVKPYAIISGKILAVAGIAIAQMIIWVAAGIGGYIAGEYIAESINPGYTNYMSLIIELISSSSDAFSIGAIIVAILMVIIGFLMYCVIAGLIAAWVDKIEDISSVMTLFQIPLLIGYLGSYLAPLIANDIFTIVVRYFPIIAPFSVPAEIMVGNMNIIEGIIALVIVAIATFALILLTGKTYKGKLFNKH